MNIITELETTVADIREGYENEEILGIGKMGKDISLEHLEYKKLDDGTILYLLFSEKIGDGKVVIEEYKTKQGKIKRVIRVTGVSESEEQNLKSSIHTRELFGKLFSLEIYEILIGKETVFSLPFITKTM